MNELQTIDVLARSEELDITILHPIYVGDRMVHPIIYRGDAGVANTEYEAALGYTRGNLANLQKREWSHIFTVGEHIGKTTYEEGRFILDSLDSRDTTNQTSGRGGHTGGINITYEVGMKLTWIKSNKPAALEFQVKLAQALVDLDHGTGALVEAAKQLPTHQIEDLVRMVVREVMVVQSEPQIVKSTPVAWSPVMTSTDVAHQLRSGGYLDGKKEFTAQAVGKIRKSLCNPPVDKAPVYHGDELDRIILACMEISKRPPLELEVTDIADKNYIEHEIVKGKRSK